jgi:cellulose synthase operon protein C
MRLAVAGLVACVLTLAPIAVHAQAANSATTQLLLDKAHSFEVRGRMDLAAQTWQQILLADPNNTEALGGLARAAKMNGNAALSNTYLDRLKAINPNDPNIARVDSMLTQQNQVAQLQQAGKLAQAGQYAQAMDIYRQVFGSSPPAGDWALAYYETEAATEDGRPHAIAGLEELVAKYPLDSRYQVTLGRILTYNPKTRAQGQALLAKHPADPEAADALRQSLLWDSQNPATGAEIRAYLSKHNDPELAKALRESQAQAAKNRGPAARALSPEQQAEQDAARQRTATEAAAYSALNAKNLPVAEERFKAILANDPENASALAGMGYVRMNQQNFGGAISFLTQAKQNGSKDPGVDKAIATSRFYYTLSEGAVALNENDLTTAEQQYRNALQQRPGAPEALLGLGGTLLKAQQPEAAMPVFAQYVKVKPSDPAAWSGLFMAQYQAGHPQQALDTDKRIPVGVHAQLMKNPDFLRTLSEAYSAVGRDADAQRVLKGALELPFPADGKGLKAQTQMQYAALLQQANHLDQAAGLYRQVLVDDPANVGAWQGLVRVEHAMGQDAAAVQTMESMPPATYDEALKDPGFLSTLAAIYDQQNQADVAQGFLEKAAAMDTTAGQEPPVPLQLQLAAIYLKRGNAQQAYGIYRQVLINHPDRTDAWKGLLAALHSTGHDREAVAQVQQIPLATRKTLEQDPDYLQTMAGVYNSVGEPQQATLLLNRVTQHYAAAHEAPPADIQIQDAWLLFNSNNDAGLYPALMQLGGRADLTDEQRRTVQTIWANWAVRRANQAAAVNNFKRSIAILNAAARAFPDNPGVFKALAGGYLRAGNPKQAELIFKAQDMTAAAPNDYTSAVAAAIANNDTKQAEIWLRYGLNLYPHDSRLLTQAAKFEQAAGNNGRAADYYRASLAAMPPEDPGADLAEELSRPVPPGEIRLPNAHQSQDLATLMMPGSDGALSVPQPPPYLPSYQDQYGTPPVVLNNQYGYTAQPAVPSYMSNPGYVDPNNPNGNGYAYPNSVRSAPRNDGRLGDYVPQSKNDGTAAPGQTAAGSTAQYTEISPPERVSNYSPQIHNDLNSPSTQQGDLSYQAYQQAQIVRLTSEAQNAPLPAADNSTAADTTAEVYKPYVPYTPIATDAMESTSSASYIAPTRTVSQLPAMPVQAMTQADHQTAEQTDVLPAIHYLPNQASTSDTSRHSNHADIAAYQAESARAQQSVPGSRMNASSMEGQSNPPADTYSTTQYSGGVDVTGNSYQQVPQPGTAGAVDPNKPSARRTQDDGIPQTTGDSQGQQYPQPNTGRRRRSAVAPAPLPAHPQQEAPLNYPPAPYQQNTQPYPQFGTPYPQGTPPTDPELMQHNIPPLRGSYNPNQDYQASQQLSERDQAELDLATLEASYSGWLGGTTVGRYRSGTPGLDRLTDIEVPLEASVVLGKAVRLSVIPRLVFLNAGNPNSANYSGQATLSNPVPYLGEAAIDSIGANMDQPASGIGGEAQLVTQNFGLAIGYTPYEFLVRNILGHVRWKIGGGPVTLFVDRDNVKDTLLSYAGERDPSTTTAFNGGAIWGGVVQTGGGIRFDKGNEKSGLYVSLEGSDLTGYHVEENQKYDGTMGAYWQVKVYPGFGSLNVGATFFGEHYKFNELPMTYGLGGYFSPEIYFLGAVPITYNGYYGKNWHYVIAGAVGVQAFEQADTKWFPLDIASQTGAADAICAGSLVAVNATHVCAETPLSTSVGLNYNLDAEGSYRIADHWYLGGFISGNNTSNYNTISGGFFVRYLFKPQFPTPDYPTGLFPHDGFRNLRVP